MSIAIGIEIGGTKLQAGIGFSNDQLIAMSRKQVDVERGAEGIREAIPVLIDDVIEKAKISRNDICGVGVGFGGPIDSKKGITLLSHQIDGWDGFPLRDWLSDHCQAPVAIQNDASLAGYAEARMGAGKGFSRVFYMTIGSGIGGGWIVDGVIDEGQGLGAAEIGHTWVPHPDDCEPDKLENICSGWGIGARAREAVEEGESTIMKNLANGDVSVIDAKIVYAAAEQEDLLACAILDDTCNALAVSICNTIALLNPERFIIGGGVSMMGPLFWDALQKRVDQNSFNPFAGTFSLVPAALGEDVVVVGGVLLGMEICDK
jgi:glucokinase